MKAKIPESYIPHSTSYGESYLNFNIVDLWKFSLETLLLALKESMDNSPNKQPRSIRELVENGSIELPRFTLTKIVYRPRFKENEK